MNGLPTVVGSEQQLQGSSGVEVLEVELQHEEERVKCIHQPRNNTTATKIALYVPPRLDQEYYQAEVLDVHSIVALSFEAVKGANIGINAVMKKLAYFSPSPPPNSEATPELLSI